MDINTIVQDPNSNSWKTAQTNSFWGEIAPCDHALQIYECDDAFLNTLEMFVVTGLKSNESVVIIATEKHRSALEFRLMQHGYNIGKLIINRQYFPLDAEALLSKFMVNNWPDEELFNQAISQTLTAAKEKRQKVRAFGEMVALLWEQGHSGATVQLETLWNRYISKESISLFCAYPKSGFTQNASQSMMNICQAHSRVIHGNNISKQEIFYI